MKLPAGAADVAVKTDLEFLQDATVWGLFPHTHLRGKRWAYMLELPNGETKPILSVPRYDFNWQTYYMFKEPLQVPKGSKIVSTAWYDNSAANKSNPESEGRRLVGRSDVGRDAVHRRTASRRSRFEIVDCRLKIVDSNSGERAYWDIEPVRRVVRRHDHPAIRVERHSDKRLSRDDQLGAAVGSHAIESV